VVVSREGVTRLACGRQWRGLDAPRSVAAECAPAFRMSVLGFRVES